MTADMAESIDLFERHAVGLHQLRRLRAGELRGDEAARVQAHLSTCERCQGRVAKLDGEQAQVRATLPFSRLADGVARRSARRPRWSWAPPLGLAMAASLALVVLLPRSTHTTHNGTKGGSDVLLYVGGVGEPHRVQGNAQLQAGERIRLEYEAGDHAYLAVLSIDEQGQVTPLYPQEGQSQPIERGPGHMLPQSIDFFGVGRERLISIFSDAPIQVQDLVDAAQLQFKRSGSLETMGALGLGNEEIDRTVLKPGTP